MWIDKFYLILLTESYVTYDGGIYPVSFTLKLVRRGSFRTGGMITWSKNYFSVSKGKFKFKL